MADWLLNFLVSYGLPIVGGAVVPLCAWLVSRRKQKAAEAKAAEKENELAEITCRAEGPLLLPYVLHVHPVVSKETGETIAPNKILHPSMTVADDTIPGALISLDASNREGAAVRSPEGRTEDAVKFDFFPWGIRSEAPACRFSYAYDPQKRGKVMRLHVEFETFSGLKLSHTYETRHGFCELRRVYPS